MSEKPISLREFARQIGVGEKTVRDGIRLGKISKGVIHDGKRPKILYSEAIKEVEAFNLGYRAKLVRGEVQPDTAPGQQPPEVEAGITSLGPTTSLAQAQRAEKIYKAMLAGLDVQERKGILVKKADVYTELFSFGNEVKTALLLIPDRITDELIALSADRHSFYKLFYESIEAALETLSKTIIIKSK